MPPAAPYPQETITTAIIDNELAPPTPAPVGEEAAPKRNLAAAVERYLNKCFGGFGDGLPTPGLYHRILREIEYPLLSAALAATCGNQIRAADLLGVNRNTLRKKNPRFGDTGHPYQRVRGGGPLRTHLFLDGASSTLI